MRISTVSPDTITMDNQDNTVTLSRDKDINLTDDLKIKTADADELRYYLYKSTIITQQELTKRIDNSNNRLGRNQAKKASVTPSITASKENTETDTSTEKTPEH